MSKTEGQLARSLEAIAGTLRDETLVGHCGSTYPTQPLSAQKMHQISQAMESMMQSSTMSHAGKLKSPMVNSVDDVIKLVRHKILTKKQACRMLFPYLSDKEVEEMASEMVSDIILGEDDGKKES